MFLIIGGGIAGLTTAIALNKAGFKTTVVEAAPEFKPVGAGIVLAANAMRAYQKLGIDQELLRVGQPLNRIAVLDERGNVITETDTGKMSGAFVNLAIHRGKLHEVLLRHIDPASISTGKRSLSISEGSGGYTVTFEDGLEQNAKYVIVAEGINSVIRRKIIPDATLRYSGYTCWRGITDNIFKQISYSTETWGRTGRFGIVPVGDGRVYWFACMNAAPGDPKMKSFTKDDLLRNFSSFHDPITDVIKASPHESIIWNDLYDLKPMSHYAYRNLVFIGDAAHATTPNMGQGACMAIEDAVILANCLRRNEQVTKAFQRFEQLRLKRTHFIVEQSWKIGKIAQLENPFLISLRNFVFRRFPQSIARKQVEQIYDVDLDPAG